MEGKEGFSVDFNMSRHFTPSYLSITSAETGVVTKEANTESKHRKQVKYCLSALILLPLTVRVLHLQATVLKSISS